MGGTVIDEFETDQRRAIIGLPNWPDRADGLAPETRIEGAGDSDSLARAVEVVETDELADGTRIYTGRAAKEEDDDSERPFITEDGIHEGMDPTATETLLTRFIAAFGGDGSSFIAVDSGAGEFAFDLLGGNAFFERAYIDLEAFITYLSGYDEAISWAGWSEHGESGTFRPGARSDDSILQHALKSKNNQLGFHYDAQSIGVVNGVASQSGYVELHDPSTLPPTQFVGYLRDDILPSATLTDPSKDL